MIRGGHNPPTSRTPYASAASFFLEDLIQYFRPILFILCYKPLLACDNPKGQ